MFKEKFKYYKRKVPEPNISAVVDVQAGDLQLVTPFQIRGRNFFDDIEAIELGLKSVDDWQIFEFKNYPGLIFIVNPFTSLGQRYWIARSVADYSRKPSITNLDSLTDLQKALRGRSWWDVTKSKDIPEKNVTRQLRWATLGYHHNWNTKVYSETSRSIFPADLSRLTKLMAKTILNMNLNPEAGIINYYLMNSFLSGHVDQSEPNILAPLLSFSFGQTAVFLVGGHSLDESAEAIFLHSGDVIIMMGSSRLRYHGVPRIISSKNHPWNNLSLVDRNTTSSSEKNGSKYENRDHDVNMNLVKNNEFWEPFDKYISQTRINLNVRQVN